jgi:hypothetical protein
MGSVTSSGVRDRSARLSPLPRRDAGGRIHHRGPHPPPHPRPPRSLGFPRTPGPRSASRTRRGSRFTLSPLAARAHASVPPQATGRRFLAREVHEGFLPRAVYLPHRRRQPSAIPAVDLAELAVLVPLGIRRQLRVDPLHVRLLPAPFLRRLRRTQDRRL